MNCPNCHLPFVEEKAEKFHCSTCGWMEKVDKEWKSCDAPESQAPQESPDPPPEPKTQALDLPPAELEPAEPDPPPEPNPAALEPNPSAQEPNPAQMEPSPNHVKKLLGGYLTITETNE